MKPPVEQLQNAGGANATADMGESLNIMETTKGKVREEFDQALHGLEDEILRMGSLVGNLIHRAVTAVGLQDSAAAEKVIEEDTRVDKMHLALEGRVISLMANRQPVAGDLRTLASILAMLGDLERLADHAESIADAAIRLGKHPVLKPLVDIPYMSQVVRGMLHDVLEAFAQRDPVLAEAVAAKDDTVDALRAQIFRSLLTYMAENPRTISQALDFILVTQHLERAADHVTNIAERVVYMATGEMKDLNPGSAGA
jgi:phosphate transport system protein